MENLELVKYKQMEQVELAKKGDKEAFTKLVEEVKIKLYKTRNIYFKK